MRAHVTGTMRSLYWLPVAYRHRFKLCHMIYVFYVALHRGHDYQKLEASWSPSAPICQDNQVQHTSYQNQIRSVSFSAAGRREWNVCQSRSPIRNTTEVSAVMCSIKTQNVLFSTRHILSHNFGYFDVTVCKAALVKLLGCKRCQVLSVWLLLT